MQIKEIKKICDELEIRPSKKLGQNFLVNESIVEKIVSAGELSRKDTVLEIGPGLGVLTEALVESEARVVAVEKDRRLAEYMKTLKHKNIKAKNLKIINDDILKIKNLDLFKNSKIKNYKIISNLPYAITSPVLWKFLHEEKNKPEMMVLMVQKEVGERICASPRHSASGRGKPGKMSILSVMCQFFAECKIVAQVKRGNFWPIPEVDSVVIKLKIKNKREEINEKKFFEMIKIGFGQKRKMLKNNLTRLPDGQENGLKLSEDKVILALEKANLSQKIRAEKLSVKDWKNILLGL